VGACAVLAVAVLTAAIMWDVPVLPV